MQNNQEIKTVLDKICLDSFTCYKDDTQILKDIQKTNEDYLAIRRLISFLRKELLTIVKFPIWQKENGKIKKYNYKNLEEFNEVEQCVLEGFWRVLAQIKNNPKIIQGKPLADIKRIVAYRVRNASTKKVYKVLGIDRPKAIEAEEDKISQFPYPVFETEKEITNRLLIKKVITEFLKDKDKLDTLLFFATFAEVYFYGYKKTPINLTQRDIAKICCVCENTVVRRKKKLTEEFREIFREQVVPYLEL